MNKIHFYLDQASEETLPAYASHPYYGLKDQNGWLTRYPYTYTDEEGEEAEHLMLSRDFVEKYINEGASFDAPECGPSVYGMSPYLQEDYFLHTYFGGTILGYLCSIERWDNLIHDLLEIARVGGQVHHGISRSDFGRLALGARRLSILRALEAKELPIMTLGHMSQRRFCITACSSASKFDLVGLNYISQCHFKWDEDEGKWEEIIIAELYKYPIWGYYKACKEKYFSRSRYVPIKNEKVGSIKVANWRLTWSSDQVRKYQQASRLRCLRNSWTFSSHTSVGRVEYFENSTDVLWGERIIPSKRLGEYRVSRILDTYFMWKGSFSSHIEGQSIKDCLAKFEAQKRANERKQGTVFSLNDVRNDIVGGVAHFCLDGTRKFLLHRMPHVARLLARYETWADVPEEIMNIDWHLASRDIFEGYPAP